MKTSLIPSFLFYCFVSGITPGPANLCSLNAALRYGKKRALKQWKGLFTGFWVVSFMSVFIVSVFGTVFHQYVPYFSIVGAVYILWLAIHILLSKPSSSEEETDSDRGCNFKTGFFLQITNVKVIIFCLSALSSYVLPYTNSWLPLLLTGMFLPFTGPIANLVWLGMGLKLQKLFQRHTVLVNVVMAASLIFCAYSIVFM